MKYIPLSMESWTTDTDTLHAMRILPRNCTSNTEHKVPVFPTQRGFHGAMMLSVGT